jgi:hypothetical protein
MLGCRKADVEPMSITIDSTTVTTNGMMAKRCMGLVKSGGW